MKPKQLAEIKSPYSHREYVDSDVPPDYKAEREARILREQARAQRELRRLGLA